MTLDLRDTCLYKLSLAIVLGPVIPGESALPQLPLVPASFYQFLSEKSLESIRDPSYVIKSTPILLPLIRGQHVMRSEVPIRVLFEMNQL